MTAPSAQLPRSVAVLHRTGGVVRGVLADTTGRRPAVKAWREFDPADAEAVEAWLSAHEPEEVIGTLPAAAVICRTCTLPDASPEALAQALALQAEAHMPGAAPPHRMAMAVVPAAAGETTRSGIICAWPRSATPPLPATGRAMTYCPDIAALAAILNGQRPGDPVAWLDSAHGSVALALSHANGAVFRCARGDTESPQRWRESATRVLAETAIAVNHTGAFTESLVGGLGRAIDSMAAGASALIGPDETVAGARERLAGTPDLAWWRDFGIAAGAILARASDLAPLTGLKRDAPVVSPSRVQMLAQRFSRPATAGRLALACVLLAIFAPLVAARLRLSLIELRVPDLQRQVERAARDRAQLAMYRALETESWPMTKLVADIACNTPEGIEVDQIRIRHGQDVQVSGSSKGADGRSAQDLIAQMQENFRAAGIFENITPTWTDPDNFGAYDFTLHADVVEPYHRVDYPVELDFGLWTYADRLYGDGKPPAAETVSQERPAPAEEPADGPAATERPSTDEPAGEAAEERADDEDPEETGPVRVRDLARPGMDDEDVGRRGSMADRGLDGGVPASRDIPEPYAAEHIASMTLAEAQEAWARVSRALDQGSVDEATKDRLWEDWRRIRQRVRELKRAERDGEKEGEGQ